MGGGQESDPGLPLISQRLHAAPGKQDTGGKNPEITRKRREKEQVKWAGALQ